jgi:hypothetical protein
VTIPLTRIKSSELSPPEVNAESLPRRFLRGTLFWLFGLSASVLIGSLWGSAVTGSRPTVAAVVRGVAPDQIARERIAEWVTGGLASVGLIVPDGVAVADRILEMPATEQVLADLTEQFVDAAFAPMGSSLYIDPALALLPAAPEITGVLVDSGIPTDERTVRALIASSTVVARFRWRRPPRGHRRC